MRNIIHPPPPSVEIDGHSYPIPAGSNVYQIALNPTEIHVQCDGFGIQLHGIDVYQFVTLVNCQSVISS